MVQTSDGSEVEVDDANINIKCIFSQKYGLTFYINRISLLNCNSLVRKNHRQRMFIPASKYIKNSSISILTDTRINRTKLECLYLNFGGGNSINSQNVLSTLSNEQNPRGGTTIIINKNFFRDRIYCEFDRNTNYPRFLITVIETVSNLRILIVSLYLDAHSASQRVKEMEMITTRMEHLIDLYRPHETICGGDFNFDPEFCTKQEASARHSLLLRTKTLDIVQEINCKTNSKSHTFIPRNPNHRPKRLDQLLISNTLNLHQKAQLDLISPDRFLSDHFMVQISSLGSSKKIAADISKVDEALFEEKDFIEGCKGIIKNVLVRANRRFNYLGQSLKKKNIRVLELHLFKEIEPLVRWDCEATFSSLNLIYQIIENIREYQKSYKTSKWTPERVEHLKRCKKISEINSKQDLSRGDRRKLRALLDRNIAYQRTLLKRECLRHNLNWSMLGPQGTKIFLGQLNVKNKKIIDTLEIEGKISKDTECIAQHVINTHADLMTARDNHHDGDTQAFLGEDLDTLIKLPVTVKSELNSPFSRLEFDTVIKELKEGKSCGADGAGVRLIKFIFDTIPLIFMDAVNVDLLEKDCTLRPELNNHRRVIFIQKKRSNKMDIGSVRPISLLNCICKVASALITKRANYYIEKFNIFPKNLLAYIKGRRGADALCALDCAISQYRNSDQGIAVLLSDFTGAFNCLSRNHVWETFKLIGFPDAFIKRMSVLHQGTKVNFSINNYQAECIIPTASFPQGDAMSTLCLNVGTLPLLHKLNCLRTDDLKVNININDNLVHHVDLANLFSDDLQNIIKNPNKEKIGIILNLLKSFEFSGLKVQKSKTVVATNLHLDSERGCTFRNEMINLGFLEVVNKFNYLGVEFDMISSNHCNKAQILKKDEKVKELIHRWSNRRLKTEGRRLIANTFLTSQWTYVFDMAILSNDSSMKARQRNLNNFINNSKLVAGDIKFWPPKKGGLGVPILYHRYIAQKLAWLTRFKTLLLFRNHDYLPDWCKILDKFFKTHWNPKYSIDWLAKVGINDLDKIIYSLTKANLLFFAEIINCVKHIRSIQNKDIILGLKDSQPTGWGSFTIFGNKHDRKLKKLDWSLLDNKGIKFFVSSRAIGSESFIDTNKWRIGDFFECPGVPKSNEQIIRGLNTVSLEEINVLKKHATNLCKKLHLPNNQKTPLKIVQPLQTLFNRNFGGTGNFAKNINWLLVKDAIPSAIIKFRKQHIYTNKNIIINCNMINHRLKLPSTIKQMVFDISNACVKLAKQLKHRPGFRDLGCCIGCGSKNENILHIILDCSFATYLWDIIKKLLWIYYSFKLILSPKLLLFNITGNQLMKFNEKDSACILSIIAATKCVLIKNYYLFRESSEDCLLSSMNFHLDLLKDHRNRYRINNRIIASRRLTTLSLRTIIHQMRRVTGGNRSFEGREAAPRYFRIPELRQIRNDDIEGYPHYQRGLFYATEMVSTITETNNLSAVPVTHANSLI